jgi:hypothetical protein
MGCRDVTHVKWGVLTEPDHIKGTQIDFGLCAKGKVISLDAARCQRPAPRCHLSFLKGKFVGRVVEQLMPAGLRFEGDSERRIRVDIDRRDRVAGFDENLDLYELH